MASTHPSDGVAIERTAIPGLLVVRLDLRRAPAARVGEGAVLVVDVTVVVEVADLLGGETLQLGVGRVGVLGAFGTGDQIGFELLDLARGMVEIARDVLPVRLVPTTRVSISGHAACP